MSETTVMRSKASPINASPHMAGGQNHVQVLNKKPIVQVTMANGGPIPPNQRDRNVLLSRPPAPSPRRVAPEGQPAPQLAPRSTVQAQSVSPVMRDEGNRANVELSSSPMQQMMSGTAPVKPMVQVRMENGKPVQGTGGRQTSSNVVILNRQGGRPRPVQRQQVQFTPPAPQLSADQLLLARHAINRMTTTDGEEITPDIAQLSSDTLIAIDAVLSYQAQLEVAQATAMQPAPTQQTQQVSVGRAPAGVAAPRRFANRPANRTVKAPLQVRMTEQGPVPTTVVMPARGAGAIGAGAPPQQVIDVDPSGSVGVVDSEIGPSDLPPTA